MKLILSILFGCICCSLIGQKTTYYYKYDAAGNRTERYFVITPMPVDDVVENEKPEFQEIAADKDSLGNEAQPTTSDKNFGDDSVLANTEIYPNPTNGNVSIKSAQNGKLSLSNIAGENIIMSQIQSGVNSLDISNQERGTYIIKIVWDSGKVEAWKITKM